MTTLLLTLANCIALPAPASAQEASSHNAPQIPQILFLDDAVRIALGHSPELPAAQSDVRVAESRRRDAGRRPTPQLALDAENWGGNLGSNDLELTIALEQTLELGGDRRARVGVADAEVASARASHAQARRALVADVTESFLDAWVAQERVSQLVFSREIAADAVAAAAARFRAGAAPAVEGIRAEGILAITEARIEAARAELAAERSALAMRWGAPEATFDSLRLHAPTVSPPPEPDSILATAGQQPDVLQAAAEVQAAGAAIRTANAGRVPDVGARIGIRNFPDAGETGFVGGVSIPLPLWGTQSGAVQAATARRQRADLRLRSTEFRVESEVRAKARRLASAIASYRQLESRAVPAADAALQSVRATYRAGRLSYTDLLDAQRGLLEMRLALVEAAANVWRARVGLALLSGQDPFDPSKGGER